MTDGYFNIFTADSINKSAANNITRLTVKPKDANANADLNASDAVVVLAVNPTDV